MMEDGDHYEDDRYMRGGTHWEDRTERRGTWDRDEDWRGAERYGQGQSGYGAGRHQGDRSFQSRNQGYPGSFEEQQNRERAAGADERYAGRSGYYDRPQNPERQGGYGPHRWERDQNLGTGGGMHTGYGQPGGHDQSTGYQSWQGERHQYAYPIGGQRGKGPAGYQRSDERVRENVCEVLTEHDHIDATNIEVIVKNGEVFLSGSVDNRQQKRLAEDVVEQISGVKDVQNQIRVAGDRGRGGREQHRDQGHREQSQQSQHDQKESTRESSQQPESSSQDGGKRHRA